MKKDLPKSGSSIASAVAASPGMAGLFSTFTMIGLTSYGMAILQNLKTIPVRKGWLTVEELEEGLGLVQLYPGPIMIDLVAYIGYRKRGIGGALVSVAGFILPSLALMLALSWAYFRYGSAPHLQSVMLGLNAMVVAVVLNVTLDFGARNLKGPLDATLALLAFGFGVMGGNMIWAIGIGLIVGAWVRRAEPTGIEKTEQPFSWRRVWRAALPGLVVIVWAVYAALTPGTLHALNAGLLKVGAVAFGNGMTILPLLQQDVVDVHGWLTPQELASGVAFGQITPGPFLITATFIGFKLGGWVGALVATAAIFAPSFAMTMVFSEVFVHVRHLGTVRGALRGIMAVFVGLLATVVLSLGRHTFVLPEAFVPGGAALVLVRYYKWDLLRVFGLGVALWIAYLAWLGWPASLA